MNLWLEFLGANVTCILNTAWGTSAGIRQRLLEPTESQFYRHDWKALWSTKSNNDQESDGRHKLAAPCKFVWFVAMSLRFANHLHSCQSWITETYISCLNRLIIYLAMLQILKYISIFGPLLPVLLVHDMRPQAQEELLLKLILMF